MNNLKARRTAFGIKLADKLVEENTRLASKISMHLVVEATSLMSLDQRETLLVTHTLSAVVGAYEEGRRAYAAYENRHENEPSDPILRAAYCAGYEADME